MNNEVANLEPAGLWTSFERLNQVPRPSKKEERVIQFMKEFGESLNLDTKIDSLGNLLISKPATKGYENRATVVLQSHLDMVHQKNADTVFDFDNDPIQSYIDGDWVKAKGTTLGSDNGMGVAAAMAVLASDSMEHGPIQALFTIDEETGMTGAFGLEEGFVTGDILMNMDSEDEGELYIGCAGGIDVNVNMSYTAEAAPAGMKAYELKVSGLKGGHSGMEIILGRGNSNKLLNRLLTALTESFNARLASFDGGSLRNAIPREAAAVFLVSADVSLEALNSLSEISAIKSELSAVEPLLKIEFTEATMPETVLPAGLGSSMLQAIYACPNGVIRMSDEMPGLVETSTNLARVLIKDGKMLAQCLLRSSVDSAKYDLVNMVEAPFKLIGAEVEHTGSYPGWKPNPSSPILEVMKEVYNRVFGKVPDVKAVHAGLECGIIGERYPQLDMISFGPTIRNPHSPDEMVQISTVQKFWTYLIESLKAVPAKA